MKRFVTCVVAAFALAIVALVPGIASAGHGGGGGGHGGGGGGGTAAGGGWWWRLVAAAMPAAIAAGGMAAAIVAAIAAPVMAAAMAVVIAGTASGYGYRGYGYGWGGPAVACMSGRPTVLVASIRSMAGIRAPMATVTARAISRDEQTSGARQRPPS